MNQDCPIYADGHHYKYQEYKTAFEYVDADTYKRVEYALHSCPCTETVKVVVHSYRDAAEPLV